MCSMQRITNVFGSSSISHRLIRQPRGVIGRAASSAASSTAHTLNFNNCVDKAHEAKSLRDVVKLNPSALQGLGPRADDALAVLHIKTVADLGSSKYFRAAKAMAVLAEAEEAGKRPGGAQSNINAILDKVWEQASLRDILAAPPSALQGLGPKSEEALAELGIKTIADMAAWKYAAWAGALAVLAEFETADFSS